MELPLYVRISPSATSNQYVSTYRKLTLSKLYLVSDAAITKDASNHINMAIYNGAVKIAERKFDNSGSDIAEGTAEALALSGGSALDFDDLGELKIQFTKSGSGALVGSLLCVFEPRREV
tara:strand:- start:1510 stop:1869 length:360 start_codon:yes stop_codon:yes gene_type:complete